MLYTFEISSINFIQIKIFYQNWMLHLYLLLRAQKEAKQEKWSVIVNLFVYAKEKGKCGIERKECCIHK